MGFLDFLKSGSKKNRCAQCKKEDVKLPFSKKLDGSIQKFCSKECSRKYRKERKKAAKKPPASTGSSMPW